MHLWQHGAISNTAFENGTKSGGGAGISATSSSTVTKYKPAS
ncbi:MAG: hypothetical protein ACOVSW_05870 [Candidatus Kapaibacteriota bacterium]